MARKITKDAIYAFNNDLNFDSSNTRVFTDGEETALFLHDNKIAFKKVGDRAVCITNAGWDTATTKERLNGLPGVSIQKKKGFWFLNGEIWDGSWKLING